MTSAPRAVLMDLDGTLIDSLSLLRTAYDALLAEYGVEEVFSFDQVCHQPLTRTFDALAEAEGLSAYELALRHRALLNQNIDQATLVPGARGLLDAVENLGLASAIVTNADQEYARSVLAALGVLIEFDVIVSAPDLGLSKRDPAFYAAACDRLGVRLEEACHVDDDIEALEASSEAGVALTYHAASDAALRGAYLDLIRCFFVRRMGLEDAPARIVGQDWKPPRRATQRRVDALWREGTASDPRLFEGSATILVGRTEDALVVTEVPYRYVYAFHRGVPDPFGLPAAAPLGVSGVVVHRGRVLVGTRARTLLGGRAEIIPAGTLRRTDWQSPGALVLKELEEEVPAAWSATPHFVGLHRDESCGVADLVYLLDQSDDIAIPEHGPEHADIRWLSLVEDPSSILGDVEVIGPLGSLLADD